MNPLALTAAELAVLLDDHRMGPGADGAAAGPLGPLELVKMRNCLERQGDVRLARAAELIHAHLLELVRTWHESLGRLKA